ncbi:MAG: nitroreductase [Alphaproteobacteria bacterium]|nr:nitroreductase [Alphaproteobacteria bacterium]
MDAIEAITSRRSIRGFLPTPVPMETVRHLIEVAARAPSGSNIQPWHVHVLGPETRARLSAAVHERRAAQPGFECSQYKYYPVNWREPYIGRRRKIGWDLYSLCGIQKGDTEKMATQHGKNFDFFGAPVGLMLTVEADMELGSWIDCGIFVQTLMIAARGLGLHSCPQAAWAYHHDLVRQAIPLPDNEKVVCGVAIGHEDTDEPANRLRTEREPLERYTTFHA